MFDLKIQLRIYRSFFKMIKKKPNSINKTTKSGQILETFALKLELKECPLTPLLFNKV